MNYYYKLLTEVLFILKNIIASKMHEMPVIRVTRLNKYMYLQKYEIMTHLMPISIIIM